MSRRQYRLTLTTTCLLSLSMPTPEAVLELIQPLDGDSRVIFKRPYFGRERERERCDRQQWLNSREARTWTKSRTDRQVHGHFQNLTRIA